MSEDDIRDLCEQIRAGASTSDVMHWLAQHANADFAAERARAESMSIALTNANKACESIATDRDRLRAALDFYARLDHYARRKRGVPSPVQDDKGKRARAALEHQP